MRFVPGMACLFLAGTLAAQSIQVFSEFRRVDPFGQIAPPDRGGRPREILSPLLARNCHATFRVVVEAPPDEAYYLFVQQNPEDIFQVTVYKEMFRRYGETWLPDSLLEVSLPYLSNIPDRYHALPTQTAESFLVDVWVPADAPSIRMKLDVQVSLGGHWSIYPMEVRISNVVGPGSRDAGARMPPVTASTGDVALGPLRSYLCGKAEQGRGWSFGIRHVIRRNVLEDLAIAQALEKKKGRDVVAKGLLRGLGMDQAGFCAASELKSPLGPEWFLRGRDFLYKSNVDP